MAIGSGPGKMPPIMLFGFKPLAGSGLQFDKLEVIRHLEMGTAINLSHHRWPEFARRCRNLDVVHAGAGREHYSTLSRGFGEKRLVLRHNFRALTIWTLNRLFLVLADRHREGETLVTLFAKIFVNRHIGRSGLINQIYMNAADSEKTYLPAAGHDWLLPLYDPFVKLVGGEAAKRTLLDQATIQPSFRVLDLGCGTGTLALLIKKLHPAVDVVGLDPDPKALARAKRKAERAGLSIRLDQGFAHELPYKNASFDRVFSTLMFHHVPMDKKEKTLSEVRRVLMPKGSFHMLDFAGSEASDYGPLPRLFHSSDHLRDNSEERILTMMNRVGLFSCEKVMEGAMLFGSLRLKYYRARV